jgi:Asp-tRNA(Asn)/Glu-tRNA(Gln) amidotransferase A subunit family amidase
MNTVGPMARSVEDLTLALGLIAGPDSYESEVPPVPIGMARERSLSTTRFAWADGFGGIPVTNDTRVALGALVEELRRSGCQIEWQVPPGFDFETAWERWGEIVLAERAATAPERAAERVAALGADVGSPVAVFRGMARRATATMQQYVESLTRRDTLITALEDFLGHWDAFLCPVSVGPAIEHCPLPLLSCSFLWLFSACSLEPASSGVPCHQTHSTGQHSHPFQEGWLQMLEPGRARKGKRAIWLRWRDSGSHGRPLFQLVCQDSGRLSE